MFSVPVKGAKRLVVILCLLLICSFPFIFCMALADRWSKAPFQYSPCAWHIMKSHPCFWEMLLPSVAGNGTKGFELGKLRMMSKINMYYSVTLFKFQEVWSPYLLLCAAQSLLIICCQIFNVWLGVTDFSIHFQAQLFSHSSAMPSDVCHSQALWLLAWIPPVLRRRKILHIFTETTQVTLLYFCHTPLSLSKVIRKFYLCTWLYIASVIP